jgi:hypothetical protein
MKLINTLRIAILLLISNASLGQFNIQTGYDLGIVKFRSDRYNNLHRFNLNIENQFKKNIILGINTGFDVHRVKYKSVSKNGDETCDIRTIDYDAKAKTQRVEFSLGYNFNINKNSSIRPKISFGYFWLQDVNILTSTMTDEVYNGGCSSGETPVSLTSQLEDVVRYRSIHYHDGSKFDKITTISLEYKYHINNFSLISYIGFSPFEKRDFVIAGGFYSNYYMIGLRLGYTLPFSNQKPKENEK